MSDLCDFIDGYHKVVERFGEWPSFHDFEVVAFELGRDNGRELSAPVATAVIHGFRLDAAPLDANRNNVLITLRFHGLNAISISGFNHQNAILGLSVTVGTCHNMACYDVVFHQAYGMACALNCDRIEVVSVDPFEPQWGAYAKR